MSLTFLFEIMVILNCGTRFHMCSLSR